MGRFSLMRGLASALAPLLLLVMLAMLASVLGYAVLKLAGDVLSLAKIVSKITLVLLLLSVFPLKKYLQLSWTDLGFAPLPHFLKQVGKGFALSLVTLLPVLLILYLLQVHVWDDSRIWAWEAFAGKALLALLLAMLIAVGEELLFRGLLLSGLRRQMPLYAAMFASSLYYAALHFLKSSTPIAYADITPFSGLPLLAEAFANWFNPAIVSAFIALFAVGLFLAVLRSREGQGLGWSIGCHAGWVWQIKLSRDLCNVNLQADSVYLVNTYYDGVIGPLVAVWLTSVLIGYGLYVSYMRSR
ncbi:CPBP family intramembrane glutamic endopeptidase [Methylomonas sp. HW2-6]|uniref:lysostaphin resistance A-like protein n=1 Tax=Methylomonas sp. HW2-6 TaxID=3376687 RepID=UPI0040422F97